MAVQQSEDGKEYSALTMILKPPEPSSVTLQPPPLHRVLHSTTDRSGVQWDVCWAHLDKDDPRKRGIYLLNAEGGVYYLQEQKSNTVYFSNWNVHKFCLAAKRVAGKIGEFFTASVVENVLRDCEAFLSAESAQMF